MRTHTLSAAVCKDSANKLLHDFLVASPEEIDLETLAWQAGNLSIVEGGLPNAEGRLTAGKDGGVIRLKSNLAPIGRRRFTIAHEIGHRLLHGTGIQTDTLFELRTWTKGSKETEANTFAAELLMPEWLFLPRIKTSLPDLSLIDNLAEEFETSRLATAIRFLDLTAEPCAIVVSKDANYQWSWRSDSFAFRIRRDGQLLHSYTGASEIWSGKSGNTEGMVRTPAGAWLSDYHPDGEGYIFEDSRRLDPYGIVVSLLWVKEDLE